MTYSLSITGAHAASKSGVKLLTLDDAAAGTLSAQMMSMRKGTAFLCKGPDGSQAWYTLDASRSTPNNPVLLPLY